MARRSAGVRPASSRQGGGTEVEAAVDARGQLYDWGKGKRELGNLIADVQQYARPDVVA